MKHIILIVGFLIVTSVEGFASQGEITKAEAYLGGLTTVKADFVQNSSYGQLKGTFYLDRPGKLRFEYDELDDFIVADGLFIYFYDAEMGEQTNAPIGQTLADFFLRKDLRLDDDVNVQRVFKEDGYQALTVVEASDPGAGSITLFFDRAPYQLVKWRVKDAAGLQTEVILSNLERNIKLPATLFRYFDPKEDKRKYNE